MEDAKKKEKKKTFPKGTSQINLIARISPNQAPVLEYEGEAFDVYEDDNLAKSGSVTVQVTSSDGKTKVDPYYADRSGQHFFGSAPAVQSSHTFFASPKSHTSRTYTLGVDSDRGVSPDPTLILMTKRSGEVE